MQKNNDINKSSFWENRYEKGEIGWDLGSETPVFSAISETLNPGNVCILGCGNGYDAISFSKKGFNVTAVDFAETPIKNINNNTFKNLFLFDFKKLNSSINGKFLFFLSIGMIISYFTTSKILDFFLINYELYVWSIFFGLILGSLYVLIKRTNKTNVKKLLILFVGLCFGLLLSFSEPMMENRALAFVFFCYTRNLYQWLYSLCQQLFLFQLLLHVL